MDIDYTTKLQTASRVLCAQLSTIRENLKKRSPLMDDHQLREEQKKIQKIVNEIGSHLLYLHKLDPSEMPDKEKMDVLLKEASAYMQSKDDSDYTIPSMENDYYMQ